MSDMMVAMADPITGKDRLLLAPLRRTPSPDRITAALDSNRMYGRSVDYALGVPDGTVDRWEQGTEIPDDEATRRLATLTGFATFWFYKAESVSVSGSFACGRGGCHFTEPTATTPPETELRLVT